MRIINKTSGTATMSYSLKRKKSFTPTPIQAFEFSSSEEDFEQNSHYIKNTEIDGFSSMDDIDHVGEHSGSKEIINNNIDKIHRPDLSLNSSLIGNGTTNQIVNKSYTQVINNTSINNQSNVRINDSSLQTSLLNSNISLLRPEDKDEMKHNNNDRILDDLKFVKGRGQLLNKKHSTLLKNRKQRYVISKKRKIVNSENSESNTNSSGSEENDSILNIGETFELNKDKKKQAQQDFVSSKTTTRVNNSNKYKSQKAVLSEILDQNLETKNLDHRQREIVLFSLGQAKDELLLNKSENESVSEAENETVEKIVELPREKSTNFSKYKEDFDVFVHSEDIASNAKEFVQLIKADADFLSFIEVYERSAIDEYIEKLNDMIEFGNSEVHYLKEKFQQKL